MKTSNSLKIRLVLIIFSSWMLASCAHVSKPPEKLVSGYPQTSSIPLKVGLVISDDLKIAKWELKKMNLQILLGESLAKNSEALLNELFVSVVTGNSEKDFNPEDIDILVTPKMASVSQSWGASGFADSTLSVFLEWKIQKKDGRLIWIDTVLGEGTARLGGLHELEAKGSIRAKLAIDDVFKKSHEAISNAREIRSLAQSNEK